MKPKTKLVIVAIIVFLGGGFVLRHTVFAPASDKGSQITHTFDKHQYSIDDPKSIWVVVNKQRPLKPADYAPKVVTPNVPLRLSADTSEMHVSVRMAPALQQLFAAARKAGVPMRLASGYRSYAEQVGVYNAEVQNFGKAKADQESARPGHSEHQTGLAADLEPLNRECEVQTCFANTAQGKWLAQNAYKYGFLIRYPKGGEKITGYMYEPWHIRYLGTALAKELHRQHVTTLEQFFGLPAAPSY